MSVDLEALRTRLPLSDPDRHALDVVADARFAALAPGRPLDADLVASLRAGHMTLPDWDDCEPAFAPTRAVADVQTGGRL